MVALLCRETRRENVPVLCDEMAADGMPNGSITASPTCTKALEYDWIGLYAVQRVMDPPSTIAMGYVLLP